MKSERKTTRLPLYAVTNTDTKVALQCHAYQSSHARLSLQEDKLRDCAIWDDDLLAIGAPIICK